VRQSICRKCVAATLASEYGEIGASREKELDDQLFRLRIQKSMGQLEAAHKLKTLRRDLARVKTVLREKETV